MTDNPNRLPTRWWEIEGQNAKGEWWPLYQAKDEREGKRMLNAVFENCDAPEHERFEDFRLSPPTIRVTEREVAEERHERITVSVSRPKRRRKKKAA